MQAIRSITKAIAEKTVIDAILFCPPYQFENRDSVRGRVEYSGAGLSKDLFFMNVLIIGWPKEMLNETITRRD